MPKCFIGPMTKNVVDAVIEINEHESFIGLIPSRRQIEYDGGYVNNWDTKSFCEYVRQKSNFTIIKRDHGGEGQGKEYDDGRTSYVQDVLNKLDYIHIDPWKKSSSIDEAAQKTIKDILFCTSYDKSIKFEVGTEQAIFSYTADELRYFLHTLRAELGPLFNNIKYAVVQGGTKIADTKNSGLYDRGRLEEMCLVTKQFGLFSKEHNGDYLRREQIQDRYENGLDAINIAPEFGVLETKLILEELNHRQREELYKVCYESKKWEKWVSKDFDFSNKTHLIEVCGHYNLQSNVIKKFKKQNPDFDNRCKEKIKATIIEKIL